MPEIIQTDYRLDDESLEATTFWAVVESSTNLSKEEWARIHEFHSDKDKGLEVVLTVNGVEASFREVINRMKENAARWALEHAKQILLDRAASLTDALRKVEDLARNVESDLTCSISRLFPEIQGDD